MSRARNLMPEDQTPEDHIPGDDLPSALRQGAGKEWSEEAAEEEQLTEATRQRSLDITAVLAEAAHKGQRATAEFSGKVYSGPIVATGTDYATIQLAEQEADILLAGAVWSFVDAPGPKTHSTSTGMTIKGRLKEHAGAGARLRMEVEGSSAIMGTINTVGQDQVWIDDADGRSVYVPISLVRAVIRSTVQH